MKALGIPSSSQIVSRKFNDPSADDKIYIFHFLPNNILQQQPNSQLWSRRTKMTKMDAYQIVRLEQWPNLHFPPKLHDGKRRKVGIKPWVKRCQWGFRHSSYNAGKQEGLGDLLYNVKEGVEV